MVAAQKEEEKKKDGSKILEVTRRTPSTSGRARDRSSRGGDRSGERDGRGHGTLLLPLPCCHSVQSSSTLPVYFFWNWSEDAKEKAGPERRIASTVQAGCFCEAGKL